MPRFSSGEIGVNSRISYNPVPVVHVIRDGRKYLVDSKDLIVSDIVLLDARTSGVIPADIILFEPIKILINGWKDYKDLLLFSM